VVPAAVLRPTTRSVDASVLLAHALTPEPVRPGWPEALKMAHSVLPYERLLSVDARLEHAAARPVIVPDTIVIDHGSVFVSAAFRSACRHLGISIQPAHLGSGSEKGHIERVGGLAVLPVRVRLCRAQPGPPRPACRGPAAVVHERAAGTAR
jgi:transposase InsO family protein